MKKVLILCALMLCGAQAANAAVYAGTCGASQAACSWTYNTSTGVLTINGNGAMYDWSTATNMPWNSYRSSITSIVISGVTSIGDYAFSNCSNLTSVIIPSSVGRIGYYAISNCKKLTSLTIPIAFPRRITLEMLAFADCTGLTKITCQDIMPPSISAGLGCSTFNPFAGIDKRKVWLYLPPNASDNYSGCLWQDFRRASALSVTFNSQGGTFPSSAPPYFLQNNGAVYVMYIEPGGTLVSPPPVPNQDGYTFCGWYKEAGCTNEWNFNTAVTSNITLFAKWLPDKITVTYKCVGVGCNSAFGEKKVDVLRNP